MVAGRVAGETRMPSLSLRINLDPAGRIGPGKVELLERIAAAGSISGGARAMGMSYKHAWDLVEEMNGIFGKPVVDGAEGRAEGRGDAADGARGGGGAAVPGDRGERGGGGGGACGGACRRRSGRGEAGG